MVLLPSALVFLILLCNDQAVLGPRVNPRWLNVIAGAVVAGFLVLSGLLVVSTLFPGAAIGWPAIDFSLAGAAAAGAATMPHIESLPPAAASSARTLGLLVLRGYVLLAAAAVVTKVIELLLGR